MNILLDTHIFLWYISGDERLPKAFRTAIQNSQNDVYLSPK
jgi:PIN domain nuclease of toxin-antitoxin system